MYNYNLKHPNPKKTIVFDPSQTNINFPTPVCFSPMPPTSHHKTVVNRHDQFPRSNVPTPWSRVHSQISIDPGLPWPRRCRSSSVGSITAPPISSSIDPGFQSSAINRAKHSIFWWPKKIQLVLLVTVFVCDHLYTYIRSRALLVLIHKPNRAQMVSLSVNPRWVLVLYLIFIYN